MSPGPLLAAAGWLGLLDIYVRRMPGTFYFEDSAELIACAVTLGNTHSPGYPLLSLVGKLAMLFPAGSPAFRFNFLGAVCAAGAAIALGALAFSLTRRFVSREVAYGAGAFAAVIWGLSDAFWWQAQIGEKYAAFYLAFVVLAWAAGRLLEPAPFSRSIAGLSLVWGLSLAHHLFSLFALPLTLFSLNGLRKRGGLPAGAERNRALGLCAIMFLLPLSTKLLYPPVRSASYAPLDWGRPQRAAGLISYLSAARYRQRETPPETRGPLGARLRLASRLAFEEFPPLLIVAAPLGAARIAGVSPPLFLGLTGAAILNALYVTRYSERVARWWQAAYAVLILFAAAGLAEMAFSFARVGWVNASFGLMAGLAVFAGVWQFGKSDARNDLSRFYAARDLGRNIQMSLPKGSVYLGRGDTDLFGMWELRFVEGLREDVDTVGLGTVVDARPADAGALALMIERTGVGGSGWEILRRLVEGRGMVPVPVFSAKTGFDPELWYRMGEMMTHQARGVTARFAGSWEFQESWRETARLYRAYSLRGVAHGRSRAVFDPEWPRDELALDGLIYYADSLVSFAVQSLTYGQPEPATWAFRRAKDLLEGMTGPLEDPAVPEGFSSRSEARLWGRAVSVGYEKLARRFEKRGIRARAAIYLGAAAMCRQ